MFDNTIEMMRNISQSNPGALSILREVVDNPDKRQVQEDLKMLLDKGPTGSRLYIAYKDVRTNYLRCLEEQPEGYKNPFEAMTVQCMLEYLRADNALYADHVNRLFTGQRMPPFNP